MHKFLVTFIPNTSFAVQQAIKFNLGVQSSSIHDTYMGLLAFVGRNKRVIFHIIHDWVWQKLQG